MPEFWRARTELSQALVPCLRTRIKKYGSELRALIFILLLLHPKTEARPELRLITGIENIIWIFYLAVVVSRLVSPCRPRNRQQRRQPADQPIE